MNANTTNTKQLSGPKSYRDFRETVARSLCAHRFCSGAVQSTALYSLLSCCFKMESDRAKWSNHVHSYISRVLAQGKNTPPFVRTYHSWPTGPIPAALSSWILHLTVLVRVSCPFTPSSKRNLFTKNSLMMGTAPKNQFFLLLFVFKSWEAASNTQQSFLKPLLGVWITDEKLFLQFVQFDATWKAIRYSFNKAQSRRRCYCSIIRSLGLSTLPVY